MTTAAPSRARRDRPGVDPVLAPPGTSPGMSPGTSGHSSVRAPAPQRDPGAPPYTGADLRSEAREKDMLTFRLAGRRRTLSTLVIGIAMIGARIMGVAGVTGVPWSVAIGILSLGVIVNEVAWRLGTTPRFYRAWLRYFFATYDAIPSRLAGS